MFSVMCIGSNSPKSIFGLYLTFENAAHQANLIQACGRCYLCSEENERKSFDHCVLSLDFVSKEYYVNHALFWVPYEDGNSQDSVYSQLQFLRSIFPFWH